jgi:hypothetical protein
MYLFFNYGKYKKYISVFIPELWNEQKIKCTVFIPQLFDIVIEDWLRSWV